MRRGSSFLLGGLIASSVVSAHLVGGGGLVAGLAHPLLGLDHLLAILAVGVLAGRSERVDWRLPALFVCFMLVGGVVGMFANIPFVEAGIVLSVVLLGVLIALRDRVSEKSLLVIVGVAALLHGHAHGTELPAAASPFLYALGFAAVTGVAHVAAALLTHRVVRRDYGLLAVRAAGVIVALCGLSIML